MQTTFDIIQGDAIVELKKLAEAKIQIHCVVTSPPYFQKRLYGVSDKELGNEKLVEEYITGLCDVFDAIPLHPLGSVWVNIGDKRDKNGSNQEIPAQFALEMKRRGWLIADSVVWAKVVADNDGTTVGGCMTEPSIGRLNGNGYEMLYRFVKTKKVSDAWSDTSAVRIPRQGVEPERYLPSNLMSVNTSINGRNLSNVWRVNMGQTKDKHFAVYPAALCERPIAMSCPPFVLPDSILPRRDEMMVEYDEQRSSKRVFGKYSSTEDAEKTKSGRMDFARQYVARMPQSNGWLGLKTEHERQLAKPGVVLDPFCGSGSTGVAALKLGRSFIGIDLYEEYCQVSRENCQETLDWVNQLIKSPSDLILGV